MEKLKEVDEKDRVRNFQPPITGEIIMSAFGLQPCREVGIIKTRIKDAILDGDIHNDYDEAYALRMKVANELGLVAVK
jgi:poly(A) polymerase